MSCVHGVLTALPQSAALVAPEIDAAHPAEQGVGDMADTQTYLRFVLCSSARRVLVLSCGCNMWP